MKNALFLATMLTAGVTLADEPTEAGRSASEEVRDALEAGALPATPPTLPEQTSDAARRAHDEVAFGKKGRAQRAAHAEASQRGLERAREAAVNAGENATRGLSRAEGQAGGGAGDARAATGRSAAEAGRGMAPVDDVPGARRR